MTPPIRPPTRRPSVDPTTDPTIGSSVGSGHDAAAAIHDGSASGAVSRPAAADRREMLAPPTAGPRRAGRAVRLPRMTRGWVLVALVVSLVVLLAGAVAAAAFESASGSSTTPVSRMAVAQPLPVPTVDPDPCASATPPPTCIVLPPTTTPPPTTPPGTEPPLPTGMPTGVPTLPPCEETVPGQLCQPTDTTAPTTLAIPCTGEGCIPQPGTTTAPPTNPDSGQSGEGEEPEDECGITDIGACLTEAINAFFRSIVEALNPLLDLLAKTLLTTPMPEDLPRIAELWNNSWEILLVSYGLLILIAGVVVMGYQTLQTRYSIKEIAPRIVVGFLAGALSLWVATKAIQIANALAQAVMGAGVDASQPMVGPGQSLKDMILGALTGGIWIIFLGIFLAGMLVVLLVTYVVRVAFTLILIAGAPLALMFHALPQTEGIAVWWWKAIGGCLAIQVIQSLTLVTAMRVFFAPGGFTMFGPNASGLVNLLVAMALMYILFKIPFWVLSSIRGRSGRSLIGSLVKGYLAYKTFGLLGGRGGGTSPRPRPSRSGSRSGSHGGRGGSPNPYANLRTTASGQYMLPMPGVRRTRPTAKPKPASGPAPKRQGRQLELPLGDDWPENKPVLVRDGQYRLPLDVQRVPRTTPPPPSPTGADPRGRRPRGRQLELPFDPYKGIRPTRSGQYPLPLDGVRRVPRPTSTPTASTPPATRPSARGRVVQPELPFDPFTGNRPTRSGQYPLPLDGVRRTPAPKPTPPPAASPSSSSAASRAASPAGRQLRLPLDLPKPAKAAKAAKSSRPPRPSPKPRRQ